jgi:hypothetical protein
MGYQPNLEREEYSPPDKKRVSFVVFLAAVAVIVVALIVYGLFVMAKGMIVVPTERAGAETAPRTLAEQTERPLTRRPSPARLSSPKSARGEGRMTMGACPTSRPDFGGES